MTINVTQRHISNAVPHKSQFCPVALAVKEATGAQSVEVGHYKILINNTRAFGFPDPVLDFVVGFDSGLSVKPFSFDLPLESS